jgi:hypothetical protein
MEIHHTNSEQTHQVMRELYLSPTRSLPIFSCGRKMNWPTSILHTRRHLASPVSINHRTNLFTHQDECKMFECPYCGERFYSLGGHARHISQTKCRFLERARLAAERAKRSFEFNLGLSGDSSRAPKRVRFVQGDVTLDVEPVAQAELTSEIPSTSTPPHTQQSTEPKLPSEPELFPENSSRPSIVGQSPSVSPHEPLVMNDGGRTYIEPYLNSLAGSPIHDSITPPFDLRAYIQGAGPLSNLENFNNLELLMTVGLTNQGRDRMLKSRAVSVMSGWR